MLVNTLKIYFVEYAQGIFFWIPTKYILLNSHKIHFGEYPQGIFWWVPTRYILVSNHKILGWSGGAKVSCSLHHLGVQLILAYSWARPATLVAGKGRGGIFFISSVSTLSFLFLFLPCPSLPSPLLSILSLFSLFLGDDTKWPTRVDVSLNPNSINNHKIFLWVPTRYILVSNYKIYFGEYP